MRILIARGRDVAHFVDYLLQGSGIDIQQIGDGIDLEALGDYFQNNPFPEEHGQSEEKRRHRSKSSSRSPHRREKASPQRSYIDQPLPQMDALREIDSDSDRSPKAHSAYRKRVDGIDDEEDDADNDTSDPLASEGEERMSSRERSRSPYHHRTHRHHASDAFTKHPHSIQQQQHSTKLLDAVSKRLVQAG